MTSPSKLTSKRVPGCHICFVIARKPRELTFSVKALSLKGLSFKLESNTASSTGVRFSDLPVGIDIWCQLLRKPKHLQCGLRTVGGVRTSSEGSLHSSLQPL